MSRRDVSKRALRRMAYQVNRPGVRAVLHDALLETFPEQYTSKIEFAEKMAAHDHHPYIVMFNPQALKKGSDRAGNVYAANRFAVFEVRPHFYTFRSYLPEFIRQLRSQNYPDHVLVYIAGLQRVGADRWRPKK